MASTTTAPRTAKPLEMKKAEEKLPVVSRSHPVSHGATDEHHEFQSAGWLHNDANCRRR